MMTYLFSLLISIFLGFSSTIIQFGLVLFIFFGFSDLESLAEFYKNASYFYSSALIFMILLNINSSYFYEKFSNKNIVIVDNYPIENKLMENHLENNKTVKKKTKKVIF